MSDAPMLSTLALPAELVAEDLIALRDEISARIGAVVRPKGKRKGNGDSALPEGLEPIDALPPHIERPWRRFDAATTNLLDFRTARAAAHANDIHTSGDETEQSAANTYADDRWRAFERWNAGAAALADDGADPAPAEARWLHAQLFAPPEGLRFITRHPRSQWTAMVQRMKVLEGQRAQAVIAGFGGGRHEKQLIASHRRFGNAYGFTAPVIEATGPTAASDGRSQWVTARDALRTLLQKIETYADPEIEGSEALSAYLLAPYLEMVTDMEKSRRTRAKKSEAAPAPAAPAEPTP